MAHQVIARKWRPQTFDEVTGQDHITRTLRNGIEHGRLHHAYIFSGARGVGKTTTARLFAKALNCHKTDGPNAEPCKFGDADICASCLEITESRSMDVIEFDAASNTGVQDIRDIILENINVSSARDRYKIFIIDEVHMLSTSSFNALLKTVEEPPPNVVFVMATTELHKVPDTITSRSQEFIFRTIPQAQICARLRLIAEAENITIDEAALQMIARSGEGSMRDAQSNFDQVISFSEGSITSHEVTKALGLVGSEVIEKIISAVATGESKAALDVVAELVDRGQDLRTFCRDILSALRDLLVFKVSGGESALIETSILLLDNLKAQAERFSDADLVRLFHSLADTETKLRDAVQSRYVLEVGLVKLIEMRKLTSVEDLLDRLHSLETSLNGTFNAAAAPHEPEKKTLDSDSEPEFTPGLVSGVRLGQFSSESVFPVDSQEPDLGIGYREFDVPQHEFRDPKDARTAQTYDNPSFIESLPVKLPRIASEELEHFDHKVLDALYDRSLSLLGENQGPIPNAARLAQIAIGQERGNTLSSVSGNGGGTAAAPARTALNIQVPDIGRPQPTVELPWPGDEPSDEQLDAYVNSKQSVERVKRIFRAKVVGISRM